MRRMLKKAVQQGRSERKGEEVRTALLCGPFVFAMGLGERKSPTAFPTSENLLLNVESLSDARATLVGFFSIL